MNGICRALNSSVDGALKNSKQLKERVLFLVHSKMLSYFEMLIFLDHKIIYLQLAILLILLPLSIVNINITKIIRQNKRLVFIVLRALCGNKQNVLRSTQAHPQPGMRIFRTRLGTPRRQAKSRKTEASKVRR